MCWVILEQKKIKWISTNNVLHTNLKFGNYNNDAIKINLKCAFLNTIIGLK